MPDITLLQQPNIHNDPSLLANDYLYVLTRYQFSQLMQAISSEEIQKDVKYIFASPYETIRSIRLYPFKIVDSNAYATALSANQDVRLGFANLSGEGGMSKVPVLRSISPIIDMGTAFVEPPYSGISTCINYNPFTHVRLYLPYIGFTTLDASQVMGRTLEVKYVIDYLNGTCTAYTILKKQTGGDSDDKIISVDTGVIGLSLPILSNNETALRAKQAVIEEQAQKSNTVTSIMTGIGLVAATIALATATGGAGLGVGIAALSGTATGGIASIAKTDIAKAAQIAGLESHFGTGGSVAGLAGWYGPQMPMLYISHVTRVLNVDDEEGYQHLNGQPYGMIRKLEELHGYTEVERVHLETPEGYTGNGFSTATIEELAELEQILKSGVILP